MYEQKMWQPEVYTPLMAKQTLTPSYYGVPVEVSSLRKEGLHQQSEEIQSFNEQPEIVRHDTVM